MDIFSDTPVSIHKLIEKCSENLSIDLTKELFSSNRKIKHGAIILLNGKNILHLNNTDTLVNKDDVVSIFPPAGGG